MIICVVFNSFTADELKLSHRPRVLARSLWLQKPGSAWGAPGPASSLLPHFLFQPFGTT